MDFGMAEQATPLTNLGRHTHGGDVALAALEAGIPRAGILDFSANVNPLGLPARAAERLAREAADPKIVNCYPSREDDELHQMLCQRLDLPPASIVIGAGADALIHAAIHSFHPRRCLIPIPAFGEYERAASACGCQIEWIPRVANFTLDPRIFEVSGPGDLVVLNNPQNPSGACVSGPELRGQIDRLRAAGAYVLADEAFIDYGPADAITRDAAAVNRVIAVRSLTKFFGCPGLRVGYAVAAPETAARLEAQLPAWPVTTLARNALAEALADTGFIREAIQRNEAARNSFAAGLADLACHVFPSAANFLLLRLPHGFAALTVRERLLREHGILVRECDSFAGLEPGRYLRVAVRLEEENVRLILALAQILEETKCRRNG
jgi:threonine-phosphate decarboxylase